mmetsp:Transcript_52695/g.141985  ORF Transcript_52695/g.141985 Transcript_52695/m.141985 type:complete len:257 (+) Transcript_52695:347-1117(+)
MERKSSNDRTNFSAALCETQLISTRLSALLHKSCNTHNPCPKLSGHHRFQSWNATDAHIHCFNSESRTLWKALSSQPPRSQNSVATAACSILLGTGTALKPSLTASAPTSSLSLCHWSANSEVLLDLLLLPWRCLFARPSSRKCAKVTASTAPRRSTKPPPPPNKARTSCSGLAAHQPPPDPEGEEGEESSNPKSVSESSSLMPCKGSNSWTGLQLPSKQEVKSQKMQENGPCPKAAAWPVKYWCKLTPLITVACD